MASQRELLEHIGLEVSMPDGGCCGTAGSFGFIAEKYDVSLACGERVLLPEVRALAPDALIIADGFSCGEQVSQSGGRQALHLSQVLRMALRQKQWQQKQAPR